MHPALSRQMSYILVVTEYLTKWAETNGMKEDDAKTTVRFLYDNIISRFGCPKVLVYD